MMSFSFHYGRTMISAIALVSLFALAGNALAAPVPFTQEPFTDISEDHPHYDAIEFLRKNNIVRGYQDGSFKPDNRINRAEFVTLITNPFFLQGEKMHDCIAENNMQEAEYIFFPDVRRGSWYEQEVCIAKVKDLVNGYLDGTFKPGMPIIFVEAAKIVSNTFALNVREEGDVWYEPYVTELGERNAIPMSVRTLNGLLTRGEMAEILFRLKTLNNDKASKSYADLQGRFE